MSFKHFHGLETCKYFLLWDIKSSIFIFEFQYIHKYLLLLIKCFTYANTMSEFKLKQENSAQIIWCDISIVRQLNTAFFLINTMMIYVKSILF